MMTIWPLQHWTPPNKKKQQHWTPPNKKHMRTIKIAGGFVSPSIDKTFWLGSNRWSPMPWCKGWKQTWGPRHRCWSMGGITRWWFQRFFIFHPEPWGDDPIWRAYFSNGLKLPTRLLLFTGSPEKNDGVDFINEKVPCSFLLSSSMCNFMMKVWQNDSEESFW